MSPRVVLVDNYDSFTWNLAQYLGMAGANVWVVKNDAVTLQDIRTYGPSHIVLSPGPGRPEVARDFGVCADVLRDIVDVPLLGVCLGHQGMAHALGGRVVHAPAVMHGRTSPIQHDGTGLFAGIASPMTVMRYHSLLVDRNCLPPCLTVTAETEDGLVMGIAHSSRPWWGVQFHPESIGTPDGLKLLRNFVAMSQSN